MKKNIYALLLIVSFLQGVNAQLDNIHYFAPLHSRAENLMADHHLYLSTPEQTPFQVYIYDGAGTLLSTQTISEGNPVRYQLGLDENLGSSKVFIPKSQLYTKLTNKGLRVEGNHKFYAEIRVRASNSWHAEAFTGKGKAAIGKEFRIGSFPQFATNIEKNFVAGIMSLDNNNTITISDFSAGVTFETPTSTITQNGSFTITLNAGETFVLSGYLTTTANYNGFVGALVKSTGNIVLSSGNMAGNLHPTTGSKDFGIDQMVPVNRLGTDYVVIEGNGDADMERPFVIAHYNNTSIYLNNNSTPTTTINAGDYYIIPNSFYQGSSHRNMFIQTSKPAYVFQALAANDVGSGDFNLIPPLHCRLPNEINSIPDVARIGTSPFVGNLFITTIQGATVTVNGVTQTNAVPTQGGGYETYKVYNVSGNQKITSTKAVSAGVYGSGTGVSYSNYYSGFADKPYASLTAQYDSICQGSPDSLIFEVHNGTAPYTFNYSMNGNTYTITTSDTVVKIPINTNTSGTITYNLNSIESMNLDGLVPCTYIMADEVKVVITPSPTFSVVGNNPTNCSTTNGSILISGLNPNQTYSISYSGGTLTKTSDGNGEVLINNVPTGTYTNFVVSQNGCSTSAPTTSITLTSQAPPTVNISSNQTICEGDSTTISASNYGTATISWDNGLGNNATHTVSPLTTTTYTVTATENNCSITK